MKKTVLFYRDYRGFTGGHLKVYDYFQHVNKSDSYRASICIAPTSSKDHLWKDEAGCISTYDPYQADILFIAGLDWIALNPFPQIDEQVPIVNLIQGMGHARLGDPRREFLSRRATRICISSQVAKVVQESGACNGPVHVIPNGIDFRLVPQTTERDVDVFVGGLKQRSVAHELASLLRKAGLTIDVATQRIPRAHFLARMIRARIAVLLPLSQEGFFLPALEAMALGCVVVCPDCVGNREFCIDRTTCLMPAADPHSLQSSVLEILNNPSLESSLRSAGLAARDKFDISYEREAFLRILGTL
jgi:hypothetical protein